jgi:hypothetical protein
MKRIMRRCTLSPAEMRDWADEANEFILVGLPGIGKNAKASINLLCAKQPQSLFHFFACFPMVPTRLVCSMSDLALRNKRKIRQCRILKE